MPRKGSDMSESKRKVRGVVDLVFLIDTTGSMAPCIDALKRNIRAFVESLTEKDANNSTPIREWRAKVVGYRDYEVDDQPLIDHPFVTSPRELETQLGALYADGGGDEPESLLDALYQIATMPATAKGEPALSDHWRHKSAAARIVIIFTDASYKDPLTEPKGATFEDVAHVLETNRIILSIFAPEMACYDKLRTINMAEWNIVRGDIDPQRALEKFTADKANFRETMRQLARTVSQTAQVERL